MNDMTDTIHLEAAQIALSQALRVAEIHASPTNPRKTFPEVEQAELIESVKRHGVMQPILVRPWPAAYGYEGEQPKYELIAGERRYRAAKAAGLEFIPGTVRDLDDHETLELQIVENLHRKDLNELEEAEGYELMTKQYGYTAEQLAEKIGKSKAYIYARLKLTAAGDAARKAFRDGTIDASRLLLIARIPTAGLQAQALEEITTKHWIHNYRDAAEHVQSNYMLKLAEAPFPRADADLVPTAGKCHPCPKRTGSNRELYPDVKSADICTDPACYAAKKAAHFARVKEDAVAQGKAVIDGDAARKIMPDDYTTKGFLRLDEKCYNAGVDREKGTYPTYRELLADKPLPVTLIEKPDGSLVEAIDEKAFKDTAADLGIKSTLDNQNDDQKKREAAAKEETEVRRRVHAQIRAAIQEDIAHRSPALELAELQLVARQYFASTWHENQKRLARLWIDSEEKIGDTERIHRLGTMIEAMTAEQACLLLIDLALIGTVNCGPWEKTETPAPLLAAAQHMNVSVDTVRREVKAEAKAKAKGKTSTAPTAKSEQPAAAEVQVETAPAFNVGDRVRIKDGLKGPGGHFRKCCGREGIVAIYTSRSAICVDTGPGTESVYCAADELELLPPTSEATTTTDTPWPNTTDLKAGDRVRVKTEGLRPWRLRPYAGKEGVVQRIDLDEGDAYVIIDGDDRQEIFQFDELEQLSAAPAATPAGAPAEMNAPARKITGKPEVIYRHPDESTLEWTGRGRKPKWVEAWLDAGGTLDQLKIRSRCDKTLELPGVPTSESEPQHQEAT